MAAVRPEIQMDQPYHTEISVGKQVPTIFGIRTYFVPANDRGKKKGEWGYWAFPG